MKRMAMMMAFVVLATTMWSADSIQLSESRPNTFDDSIPSQFRRTATHLSQLLRIRQQMEILYSPLAHAGHEVHDLGDGIGMEAMRAEEHKQKQTRTYALLTLDQQLVHFEKAADDKQTELGESWYPPSTEAEIEASSHTQVDSDALERLMDAESSSDTTESVNRIVEFLANARKKHELLSRAELDRIRQFYIDQTAGTLARYGFENSPFGHNTDDSRIGDEVAARKHMDSQDELMHAEGDAAGPTKRNENVLVRNLKQTAYLSQFLDRITSARQQMEQHEDERGPETANDSELSQLTSVQTDEENITNGIEQLLKSIRSGSDLKDGDAAAESSDTVTATLKERTEVESARLTKLESDLAELPSTEHSTAAQAHPASRPPVTREAVRVPLAALQQRLDHSISAQLDDALGRFKTMGANGNTVDPALKARIEHYMSSITANTLHQCASYQMWNQQKAVTQETTASRAGEDTLSRTVPGLHLSSRQLVSHFLESKRLGAEATKVPSSLQHLMTQGVELPGLGRLVVSLRKP